MLYNVVFVLRNTGFFSNNWWEQGEQDDDKRMDCTVEELHKAVKGYFTADANPESLSHKPGISGRVSRSRSRLHTISCYPTKPPFLYKWQVKVLALLWSLIF